jgi:predicted nucleic acid-binding protein
VRQVITRPKLFLDSSGLISAVISPSNSSAISRMILLGEADVLDLRISREVIGDTERYIRARDVKMLPLMADVISTGRMATTPDPDKGTVDFCQALTGYRPDARILAAAVEANVDILVTNDSTHLLGNAKIAPPDVRVMVMSPHDALEWCYQYWMDSRNP